MANGDKLVLPVRRKKNFHSFFQVENFPGHWLPPVRKWTESSQLSSVFNWANFFENLVWKLSNSIWPFDFSPSNGRSIVTSVHIYPPSLKKKKKKIPNFSTNNKDERDRNRGGIRKLSEFSNRRILKGWIERSNKDLEREIWWNRDVFNLNLRPPIFLKLSDCRLI